MAEVQVLLSARVPASLKLEFEGAMLDARRQGLRRAEMQMGISALVRMLRDPDLKARWIEELSRIVREG